MFITYDPNQTFPQAAQLGRGIVERQTSRDGSGEIVESLVHTPPDGLSSFEAADSDLVHGTDERFYQVVSGPALQAKTQSEVDAIVAEDRKPVLDNYARRLARDKRRATLGAENGIDEGTLQSEFLSLQGRAAAKIRREANGREKPGESTELDQLEAQADALEAIDVALTAVRGKVADGTYTTESDIDTASEWP